MGNEFLSDPSRHSSSATILTTDRNITPAETETMEVEKGMKSSNPRKRRRNICLAVTGVVLGIVLIFLILGLTVLKPKRPITTVNSVELSDLQVSIDIARLRVSLNASLDVSLSVKNKNKVSFKYQNSSASIKYYGEEIADAPIPAGKVPADKTLIMNLTLTVLADRLISNGKVYADVKSGNLPLTATTRIAGKAQVLKIFKIHAVSYTACDINVDVMARKITNQTCHYKTKL